MGLFHPSLRQLEQEHRGRNHGGMMLIGVLLISAQPAFLNSTGPAQDSTAQSGLGLLYQLPVEKMPTDRPTGQSEPSQ